MPSEQEVFTEALSFTEAAARAEYLDRVCGADNVKRQRLNELLTLHERADSVLDRRPQDMIESLSDDGDLSDSALPSPNLVLASLKPFLEPATRPDSLGRLSHYELLEILGQGGYGIVYEAFDTKLSRLVAIKILSPHLATTSPPRRRFLREARAAAAVRHENVVQIYAVEEIPIPYLVMEFVSGETLQQRSDRLGPFDAAEVVRLGQQIARGLAAAHEQGLIHRDIKPGNILIAHGIDPVAKLTDFGLARTADDASRSQSGIVVGTPMYMSPEQVSGDEVDQRTDLFSFGSVLYLMTSGRPPFRAPTTLAVLKRVAEDKPRLIRDVIAGVPEGLCTVISRLHSKSREARFLTAKDVEAALAACLIQPVMTWQRRWADFSNRSKLPIFTSAAVVLLVAMTGMVIAESAGFTHVFQSGGVNEDAHSNITAAISNSGAPTTSAMPISNLDPPADETAPPTAETKSVQPAQPKSSQPVGQPPKVAPLPNVPESVALTEWDKGVMGMTTEEQSNAVVARFVELNPKLVAPDIKFAQDNGAISGILIESGENLVDISAVRPLRSLKGFRIVGSFGGVTDLSPLRGLKLEKLEISGHPIRDLSPLEGMPLTSIGLWQWHGDNLSPLRGMRLVHVNLGGTFNLRDLEPLRGMPIQMACFNYCPIEDLSPLKGMPLSRLEIQNTKVTDLTPLVGLPLEFLGTKNSPISDFSPLNKTKIHDLTLTYNAERDRAPLQSIPELKTVNGKPLAEFLANQ